MFCDDYTSMLGVYADVLFATNIVLSKFLSGREGDISNVMVCAYQTTAL